MSKPPRSLRVVVMGTTPESPFGGMATAIQGFLTALSVGEIEWRFIPTHDSGSRWGKVIPWLCALPRLIRCRFGFRPDVAWVHSGAVPSMVRIAGVAALCRMLGIPVLWHLHCPTVDWWLDRPWRRAAFRLMTLPATKFAVVVPWWTQRLAEVGIRKEAVAIPNVVEDGLVSRSELPLASSGLEECVFFTACRLVDGKGADRLIRAAARCRQPIRIVIAGDGPQRPALENLANTLGHQNRIEFAGWLNTDQLQELRNRSDAFVLVSTLDSFGMGYIEAAASGLPAIGARWQAIPDVVADGEVGILVDPTDIDALAVAMDGLASDPELRARMGAAGQESVRRLWSPEARARTLQAELALLSPQRSSHVA